MELGTNTAEGIYGLSWQAQELVFHLFEEATCTGITKAGLKRIEGSEAILATWRGYASPIWELHLDPKGL